MDELTTGLIISGGASAISATVSVTDGLIKRHFAKTDTEKTTHDGDLGHNAHVFYDDIKYITKEGETFYCEEVRISDKMNCTTITAKEALSLLKWLDQEKPKLERLAQQEQAK